MSYCKMCAGTGRCARCDGKGFAVSPDIICHLCDGSGDCWDCQGTGSDGLPNPAPQQLVAANTAARGYREGWTAEQFAGRQVAKIAEELGELSTCFLFKSSRIFKLRWKLWEISNYAKEIFDSEYGWDRTEVTPGSVEAAKKELADIQVVVFNLAEALAEISGEPFDVVQAAVEKSGKDIERGVR